MTASGPNLWRHPDFLRLWAAQAISAFGSRITRTALPIIAVATLGQPEAIVGVLAAMQLAPGVVLAMMAGGFVDRGHKRRILIWSDLVRAVLVGSLTLAWVFDALTMLQVVVVGAGVGAASALFQITDTAYLPSLIGRRRLVEGNAKLETTEAIAEITGPASAGVMIAALGAPLAVGLDAASYVWSAFMLGRIRVPDTAAARAATTSAARSGAGGTGTAATASANSSRAVSATAVASGAAAAASATTGHAANQSAATDAADTDSAAPGDPASSSIRTGQDFRIGLRAIFGNPLVRPIVLTLMVWSITGGFFLALYTLFCLRELGLSEATFGVVIAMGGIGSLAGAVLARRLTRLLGVGRTLLVTSSLSLLFTLCVPIAASATSHAMAVGFLIAHQLLGDCFSVAFIIIAVTLRQTVLPKELLGRANAAVHVCTSGVLPVFALVAGALASLIGLNAAVWLGFLVGLAAPAFLWRLRHLKDMPAPDLGASDSGLVRFDGHR